MDAIAEKSSGNTQDAKREQKKPELYDLAKRTEPVAENLPRIIEQMQALESLHKYVNNFAQIIADIEQKQGTITTMQETIARNVETINKKVAKMEERIAAISSNK